MRSARSGRRVRRSDRARQRAGAAAAVLAAALLPPAVGLGAALAGGTAAGAGGADWVVSARDRYEAGQTVTMVGYTPPVDAARLATGPFHAWLRVDPAAVEASGAVDPGHVPPVHPTDVRVGQVVLEDVTDPVRPVWTVRASVTFDLPDDLPAGTYPVVFCDDPCTTDLGQLVGGVVHVGVDPPAPLVREWPLTDPAIRWLEDDALLGLPWGGTVTAAAVRDGAVPPAPSLPAPVDAVPPAGPPPPPPESDADVAPSTPGTVVDASTAAGRDTGPAGAWWVLGEAAVLAGGSVAVLAWRSRRHASPAGRQPPVRHEADAVPAGRAGAARPPTIQL